MKRVVVIGGGVAGLGAAYKVRRAAAEGHDVSVTVLEKDGRVGGKVASEITHDGFVVDGGPDCFLTEKPAVHRIAEQTGIADRKMPTDESRKKTWILVARQALRDARRRHDVRARRSSCRSRRPGCSPGRASCAPAWTSSSRARNAGPRGTPPRSTTRRWRASSCAGWAARSSTGSRSRSWAACTRPIPRRCRSRPRTLGCWTWSRSSGA